MARILVIDDDEEFLIAMERTLTMAGHAVVTVTDGARAAMFDAHYDHPMESVLVGHPERRIPFCVECSPASGALGLHESLLPRRR